MLSFLQVIAQTNQVKNVVHIIGEPERRAKEKLLREIGPQIAELLMARDTEDILCNPDGSLWLKRTGVGMQRIGDRAAEQREVLLRTVASLRGTQINHSSPILSTEIPFFGSRLEGIVPPVTTAPAFAIRCQPKVIYTLEQYEEQRIVTNLGDPANAATKQEDFAASVRGLSHGEILRLAIARHKNIMISGSTGSGKTTFANALLDQAARLTPNDRYLLMEDTLEMQINAPNVVSLRAAGSVSMSDCLRSCMRLLPTRIIVGEVRGGEALTLLKAWNTGHPGGVATVHANDALGCLIRLEQLTAEASKTPQKAMIGEAVDMIVFIGAGAAGRKVREIVLVNGFTAKGGYQTEHV